MAEDHRFRSITEIWLDGDHYKWRAMRANGVPERFCTGDASDWEKFEAWARTRARDPPQPALSTGPHMELRGRSASRRCSRPRPREPIYERCNARLRRTASRPWACCAQFRVAVVCTTDDPTDSLEHHAALARRKDPADAGLPDLAAGQGPARRGPAAWNAWVEKLEQAAQASIGSWTTLLAALEQRHAFFHELGCRASDHGLEATGRGALRPTPTARRLFDRLRAGRALEPAEARGLPLGAAPPPRAPRPRAAAGSSSSTSGRMRNNNTRMRRRLGPDTGFDSIGDFPQARPLARFLDRLDETDQLAKTILYNLNPADNELFATMIGNFQDGIVPGKIQWGAAWWFLDQLDGMEAQMRGARRTWACSRASWA